VLLVYGDLISNAARYVQACEGVRPDVVILDQEMMTKPWYIERARREFPDVSFPGAIYHPTVAGGFDMKAFVDTNGPRRSVHVYPGIKRGDSGWTDSYALVPDRVSSSVVAKTEIDDRVIRSVAAPEGLAMVRTLAMPDEAHYPAGTWEHVVVVDYRNVFHSRGVWLLDRAVERREFHAMFVKARDALAEAAARWPWPPPWYVAKNLGLAASKLARWEPEAQADALRAWKSYLQTAPAGEKDRAAIADEVRAMEP